MNTDCFQERAARKLDVSKLFVANLLLLLLHSLSPPSCLQEPEHYENLHL